MPTGTAAQPIRDAAPLVLLRDTDDGPAVLMGRRGDGAVFMPRKYVFPGGAVDPADGTVALAAPLAPGCLADLAQDSFCAPAALAAAAIRELWEETGQILGRRADWSDPPRGWRGFAASGHRPDGSMLRFVYRAITPPGRPRRFDARFFMANARDLVSDPDDFSGAEDELGHLHWVAIAEARRLDLPAITGIVLDEIEARLRAPLAPRQVPFFRGDSDEGAGAG